MSLPATPQSEPLSAHRCPICGESRPTAALLSLCYWSHVTPHILRMDDEGPAPLTVDQDGGDQ